MKRIITISFTLFLGAASLMAQVSDGFYYIRNAATGRRICIQDTDPSHYQVTSAASVTTAGIRTIGSDETINTSPSCIFFIRHLGGDSYDLLAQNTSLYAMTSNRLAITLKNNGGTYTMSGSYQGQVRYLADMSNTSASWEGKTSVKLETSADAYCNWELEPIDGSSAWHGIKPDATTDDGYWGSIFMGFCFRVLSPGMEVYYVSAVDNESFELKPYTEDIVPAGMPVLIKCSSADPAENQILPIADALDPLIENKLEGVYCALDVSGFRNRVDYAEGSMRVIGASDGKLAFVKAPLEYLYKNLYLPANKAYLPVSDGAAAVLTEGTSGISSIQMDEVGKARIYTLSGVRVADDTTLRPGIYIKNGRKVVVK